MLWWNCRMCSPKILLQKCSYSLLFFHCHSFSPCWPRPCWLLAFLIFSLPQQNFHVLLPTKWPELGINLGEKNLTWTWFWPVTLICCSFQTWNSIIFHSSMLVKLIIQNKTKKNCWLCYHPHQQWCEHLNRPFYRYGGHIELIRFF